MFLKKLMIRRGLDVIREIDFHKGINLIVDETHSGKKTDSGNSVGKTTVLRLIDFCLDGQGKNIYTDPEFKSTNTVVENFLKNNCVSIILVLAEDLSDKNSKEVVIERNFLSRKDKLQLINGVPLSNEQFSKELKLLIFKSSTDKPSFRQLISKNIRDEKNKLINTIRVLTPNVTTDVAYEMLHLFWLGIDVDLSKDDLVRKKNIEEKLQDRLRKESNLSQINQSLIIINKEIDILTKKKESFSVNDKYEKDLALLNGIKMEINAVSNRLSSLEMREELIEESKKELESGIASLDVQKIKVLYEKAKALVPNVQKTFQDTLNFHNEMIAQKVKFIYEEIPLIRSSIFEARRNLTALLVKERELSDVLKKTDVVESLDHIVTDLNSFHEKKGALEEQKRLWESSLESLNLIQKDIDKINTEMYSKDDFIQQRIELFNSYFSVISNKLDGVHSLLSADKVDGLYKFSIGNIEGNPGTGSKKSQMASFDLAYIKFADSIGIPCLHFVLQDQIENVHSNQINNLLTEVVDGVNCQYVMPVLRDKLPVDLDVEQYQVISLSQAEKLFKI